jgi:L-ascorbate metabolism protein UlaG (beta-lactamase superfamily)
MQLRKFGHSCLLVSSGEGRVLIDPGTFSSGFEDLDGLTAVLITHQHPDHLDVGRLEPLMERNPDARLVTDVGTAQVLRDEHGIEANVATAGESFDVGITVDVVGEQHAEIHPDIPRIPNAGYVLDGRLLHPGDALDVTDRDVEVLALPAMAPWMRMAEAIDYLRAVAPRFAVPIHEGMLRNTDLYYGAFLNLGPDGTELRVIDDGQPVDL